MRGFRGRIISRNEVSGLELTVQTVLKIIDMVVVEKCGVGISPEVEAAIFED